MKLHAAYYVFHALLIERTFDSQSAALKHMSIDHGSFDVFMTQEFLDSANVIAVFEEMSGKGMAKSMRGDELVDFCGASGLFDSPLKVCLVQMVALLDAANGVDGENGRGEDVLPGEFPVGVRVFAFQGIG